MQPHSLQPIDWRADTREILKNLSSDAKRALGYNLDRLQRQMDPEDWKPVKSIGRGAREIRIRVPSGTWRLIYRQARSIEVIHVFRKKDNSMRHHDRCIAAERLKKAG